jgi:hypothetical protein
LIASSYRERSKSKTLPMVELIQDAHGDRVISWLVFHFKDGSIHDDTAVFSQRGSLRLLSDHLTQKGLAFEHLLEVTVNGASGQVVVCR